MSALVDEFLLGSLWRTRHAPDGEHAHCPKCDCRQRFKRYATKQQRQSWTCTACGHHLHPTAGTIFHRSSTSLVLWAYAARLLRDRQVKAAKDLERLLGVSYSTAWNIREKLWSRGGRADAAVLLDAEDQVRSQFPA